MLIHKDSRAGVLWIGDPHLSKKTIGRRLESTFWEVGLDKLKQCLDIADREGLAPFILGDLMHTSTDNHLKMLNQMMKLFCRRKSPIYILGLGNHDTTNDTLSDEDAIALFLESGALIPVDEDTLVEFPDFYVTGLPFQYGVPSGAVLPDELPLRDKPQILVTHADLAFDSAYPGSLPLKEIKNCMMVVNGHMHGTKPSVKMGKTTWYNPGNILRLTVDMKDHVPSAWEYRMGMPTLKQHVLKYAPAPFNLMGLDIAAAKEDEVEKSIFASMLSTKQTLNAVKTDEGVILAENIETLARTVKPSASALATLKKLADAAISD